jgi:hypothetical protein
MFRVEGGVVSPWQPQSKVRCRLASAAHPCVVANSLARFRHSEHELPRLETQDALLPPIGQCFGGGARSFSGISPRRDAPGPGLFPKSPAPAHRRARPCVFALSIVKLFHPVESFGQVGMLRT